MKTLKDNTLEHAGDVYRRTRQREQITWFKLVENPEGTGRFVQCDGVELEKHHAKMKQDLAHEFYLEVEDIKGSSDAATYSREEIAGRVAHHMKDPQIARIEIKLYNPKP